MAEDWDMVLSSEDLFGVKMVDLEESEKIKSKPKPDPAKKENIKEKPLDFFPKMYKSNTPDIPLPELDLDFINKLGLDPSEFEK
jgi:hypothetical protein